MGRGKERATNLGAESETAEGEGGVRRGCGRAGAFDPGLGIVPRRPATRRGWRVGVGGGARRVGSWREEGTRWGATSEAARGWGRW
jgi:hypothetical protein